MVEMITSQQFFGELKRHLQLVDSDDRLMSVDDLERKWLSSKTSPIVAAVRTAPLIEAKPASRSFFVEYLVDYVQKSVKMTRLISSLIDKN
jgi:hypothetical protein